MSIKIKSAREIELMTEAGRILDRVHRELGRKLQEGMSTADIDCLGEEIIRSFGCTPPSSVIMDIRPRSVCLSMRKLYMEFRTDIELSKKGMSSLWMRG